MSATKKTRRRTVLEAVYWCGLAAASQGFLMSPALGAAGDPAESELDLIERLTGKTPTASNRVHLDMPPSFNSGYGVPLALSVDSPMTEADYVRAVHVIAPANPIPMVATFNFTLQSGRAAIATRIRLAAPQNVVAVADMSDGSLLMARSWVKVDTDGCE